MGESHTSNIRTHVIQGVLNSRVADARFSYVGLNWAYSAGLGTDFARISGPKGRKTGWLPPFLKLIQTKRPFPLPFWGRVLLHNGNANDQHNWGLERFSEAHKSWEK